jgi:hypothetical protein
LVERLRGGGMTDRDIRRVFQTFNAAASEFAAAAAAVRGATAGSDGPPEGSTDDASD